MSGGSINKALDRIDAAIARIDRAANRPAESDPGLKDRHEKLKASVSQALGQLDDLIARHGQ